MRIGILTFHRAINYGAVLQCYALQDFLRGRGHEVEVIDYRLPSIENQKKLLSLPEFISRKGHVGKLKYLIKSILLSKRMRKSVIVFDTFLKKNISLSPVVKNVKDFSSEYDLIVFGSDQIWNPRLCKGFDPMFWGQFPKNTTKFVTYAVSLGEPEELDEKQWLKIEEYIRVFDKVSVREESLKIALESKLSIPVSLCLDPTLLADQNCFEKIVRCPKESNYVFLYNVQNDPNAYKFAKQLADQLNCKLIRGQAKPQLEYKKESDYSLVEGISPEEFLGYIKCARLVIGNSFHAIALSLVFRKNFYSLDCARPGRVKNILGKTGLLDRHVSSTQRTIKYCDVDYSDFELRMAELKTESIQFVSSIE